MATVLSAGDRRRHCVLSTARLPADMTPKRPRGGRSTNRRVGSRHVGRRTQNSPSENPSGQPIQDEDIVDRDARTSEEIRRRKLQPVLMWSPAGYHKVVANPSYALAELHEAVIFIWVLLSVSVYDSEPTYSPKSKRERN